MKVNKEDKIKKKNLELKKQLEINKLRQENNKIKKELMETKRQEFNNSTLGRSFNTLKESLSKKGNQNKKQGNNYIKKFKI